MSVTRIPTCVLVSADSASTHVRQYIRREARARMRVLECGIFDGRTGRRDVRTTQTEIDLRRERFGFMGFVKLYLTGSIARYGSHPGRAAVAIRSVVVVDAVTISEGKISKHIDCPP